MRTRRRRKSSAEEEGEGGGRPGRRDREGQGSRVVRHSPDLRPYPLPALPETPHRPLPVVPRTRSYFVSDSASGLRGAPAVSFRFVPIRRKKKKKKEKKRKEKGERKEKILLLLLLPFSPPSPPLPSGVYRVSLT